MNADQAAAKLDALAKAAKELVFEVGKPCAVSFVAENGARIGARRVAGAIRFSVNGTYKSRAKALAAMTAPAKAGI